MKHYVLAILSIAMLSLAGCNGIQQEVITEQATQEAAKEAVKESPKAAGAAAELQTLMRTKESLKYQVTYDVAVNSNGQESKSTMIQYFDGANRMRTDMVIKGVSESRTYVIDGAATSCVKTNNKWMCNSATIQQDAIKEAEESIAKGTSDYVITSDGTKQLLGKMHTCYKLVDGKNAATLRYCFSSDGIPVYISSAMPQATTEMTALLYGKDVAETVWVIPA